MKRLQPNTCGYDGFRCTGITKLKELFLSTPTTVWQTEDPTLISDWVWPEVVGAVQQPTVDNYAQVPRAFEGFVMTLDPVINMYGSTLEIAELACRTNMDPFCTNTQSVLNTSYEQNENYTINPNTVNTGFLDLYNQVPAYKTIVYDKMEDAVPVMSTQMLPAIKYEEPEQEITESVSAQAEQEGTWKNLIVGPGLLEPMLDTVFPPVGIDTITGPDALGDFTVWLFNEFDQWKNIIDTKISNIQVGPGGGNEYKVNGLLNLENAKNKTSPCENFHIEISTGQNALVNGLPTDNSFVAPTYTVSGGVVLIVHSLTDVLPPSGYGIEVPALEEPITPPCELYLDLYLDTSEETPTFVGEIIYLHNASLSRHYGHHYFYIGRISESSNAGEGAFGTGSKYTLYEIEQDECLESVDITDETGGGSTCSCRGYQGPFKVVAEGSTSGSIALEPFDPLNNNIQPYTGNIMAYEWQIPAPVGTVSQIYGWADIWIHIDLTGPSVSYYAEGPDSPAEPTEDPEEPVTEEPVTEGPAEGDDEEPAKAIIDVRLARVYAPPYPTYTTVELDAPASAILIDTTIDPSDPPEVTEYSHFCTAPPEPSLNPIELNTRVHFLSMGRIYEVINGHLTGKYIQGYTDSQDVQHPVYAYVTATQNIIITQIQHGDIIVGSTVSVEGSTGGGGDGYHGPFHLLSNMTFECIETDQSNPNRCVSIGDIIYNGDASARYTIGGSPSVSGSANEVPEGETTSNANSAAKYVYAHVSGAGEVTFSTDGAPGGSPPPYTVRIAKISGATTTKVHHEATQGQEAYDSYELSGDGIQVIQYHYGDIYVDGRWM